MYADGSPRYEARETCPDAILYHKVSTLEPHPTGLPVYVVPFMTKCRDKYRYNTFPLQQEGRSDSAILTYQRIVTNGDIAMNGCLVGKR